MTKSGAAHPQKTDIKVSLLGGHRLGGETLHERTLTASPDGAELRITKLSLVGGVSLRVRPDVRVEVHGIRLGGVKDDGPAEPGGPTVRIDAWGLLCGVTVRRG